MWTGTSPGDGHPSRPGKEHFGVSKPTESTHLENSVNEAKYLLRKMHVEKETYVPGKYSWSPAGKDELRWQTIPRQSVISVYKHYFADFGKNFQFFYSDFQNDFFSTFWILAGRCSQFYKCFKSK